AGRFDPYATAIIALGAVAALGALGDLPRGTAGLTWTDGAVWLLLWIPFDLRWYDDGLWQGPRGFTYAWWALAISVLAALGWGPLRALPGLGYRLLPTVRDLGIALATLGLIAAALIPIGLALHFLHFPPSRTADPWEVAATFLGLFFTVALPEELFFRAVLQNGLERGLRRPAAAAVLAALAFGLMHWNNANSLRERIVYCALASVAGGLYGWAWRRSGGLAAPVLVHTLVDLVWKFLLR
ncbi:MAG: CPBP family intramembrane metalloprotease, partial [Planctomycetes bacterium]|nr:CPBP family intramembrane metalloprotease [Planctomycetota bacterium]